MNKRNCLIFSALVLVGCGTEEGNNSTNKPTTSLNIKPNYNINETASYSYQQSEYRFDRRYGFESIDGNFYHGVAYADFDSDGDDDLVLSGSDGISENIPLFYQNDNGDFNLNASKIIGNDGLVHPRKTIIGDFDNNGYLDIVNFGHGYDFGDFPGEAPEIYLNNGTQLSYFNNLDNFIGFNHCGASADIDSDGDIDILVGDANNDGIYFLLNDGNANFTKDKTRIKDSTESFRRAFTCELYDLNGDGYIDIIKGGHEFENGDTEILLGSSTGYFDTAIKIPKVDYMGVILDLDFGDLNSDGFLDIVVSRTGSMTPDKKIPELFYTGYYIQLLFGGVNGFVESDTIENKSNVILARLSTEDEMKPYMLKRLIKGTDTVMGLTYQDEWIDWLRIQDVNNDGLSDIVDDQVGSGIEWINDGSGNFSSEFDLSTPSIEFVQYIDLKEM